jgi:hypothetical protein
MNPTTGAASEPAPPPCKWTLANLLGATSALNEIIDSPDWSPGQIVGPLGTAEQTGDEYREMMRHKVDSIDHVVAEFEAYAERQAHRAQKIQQRANVAKQRAYGLKEYVRLEMERQGIEQLTGNDRVIFRKRSNSPSCATTRSPTEADMVMLGEDFVRVVPAAYSWQAKELIKQLKTGAQFDFASLAYSYSIQFDDVDRPDVGERKRGKKK